MKKVLLWLLALGGGFIALLVIAVLLLPKFIDIESYLPQVEQKVAEATGRSFSLGRDFDVSVFPWAGVSFNNLQLGNPEEFGGGEFVKVNSFEVRVKIMPLLSKEIQIDKFVLDGPEILLVKNADGSGNWTMGSGAPGAPGDPADKQPAPTEPQAGGEPAALPLKSLEIGEFAVTNGRLTFVDKGADTTRNIDGITLKLVDVSLVRPIEMLFAAKLDGKPLSINGTLGPIGQNPGQGTVNVDLAINAFEQLAVNLRGDIVDPATAMKFNMALNVAPFSPKELLASLGMEFPVQTTDPSALSSVGVDLNVSGDPANITVADSSVKLDDSTIRLTAALKEMEKPNVSFTVNLDSINIDRYLPVAEASEAQTPPESAPAESAGQAEQTGGAAAPAATRQPIDYGPLRKLVLDGEVTIGQLTAKGAKINNTEIKIVGENGVFDLNPCKLELYQGGLAVVGNFNFQGESPVSTVDVNAQNIQVGPLVKDTVKKEIIEGAMNMQADITLAGDTPDDIKKSLNGTGNVSFLDGALVGIDLAELGRSLTGGPQYAKPEDKPRTDFAELRVPFTLTNGLFRTPDASLQSPLLRVNAQGTADLVSEKLNMKVRPKVVGTLKGQGDKEQRSGLAVPIIVGGTFSKPEYSADLSGIASQETIEEAIKNPEAAKEKVKSLEETGKSILKGFGFGN